MTRVFAEKPLDGNPASARRIAERYDAAGRALAVNFTRRWDPEMATLRDQIADGMWGELHSIVGWYGRGVVNNGAHLLDLAAYLTGRSAEVVYVGAARDDGIAGDPTVDAVLDLGGVPFHMVGGDNRHQARFEVTLSFAAGVVEILDGGLFVRRRPNASSRVFSGTTVASEGEREPTGYGQAMLRALDDIAAWRPGHRLASDVKSAIPAIALAIDIQKQSLS